MRGAVWLMLLWSAAASAGDVLTFHPAHWTDGDDLEPTFYISPLRSLAFPSPDEGWIVGERYVLHIRGERLEVAFVTLRESRTGLSFSSPTLGWATGLPASTWTMLRYQSDSWRGESLNGILWPHWGIYKVMAGPAGDAWAFVYSSENAPGPPESPKAKRAALRYDGHHWTADQVVFAGRVDWHLADGCQSPDGQWWFVGMDDAAPSGRGRLLLRWDGRELHSMGESGSVSERSALYRIRCLPDGTIWASGALRPAKGAPLEILLVRYADRWERIAFPDVLPREASTSSLAPVSADEVWISAACGTLRAECCERFFHYRDGNWNVVSLPLMPGGRCTGVAVVDAQFVSPDEGWAVATDMEPGKGGGRIFHYKNGVWRLRNWNWHFWDAPWFNLFG